MELFNTGLYDRRARIPTNDRGLVEVTHVRDRHGPVPRADAAQHRADGAVLPRRQRATLDEVLDHYAKGGVHSALQSPFVTGFTLTAGERADLRAFLGALTNPTLATDPRFTPP